jgi:recombination protein RecR
MDTINKLTEIFRNFPGIGPRQAKRFVYYLLTRSQPEIQEIISNLQTLKKDIKSCQKCFRYFSSKENDILQCQICNSDDRDQNQLMLVSRDVDMESIEKSKVYNGKYFILGGVVPILEKNPEKKIRINELLKLIENNTLITEIILSLNANAEGEHTGDYIKGILKRFTESRNLKITTLGRGLSTGAELEYSDSDTIRNALKNRF